MYNQWVPKWGSVPPSPAIQKNMFKIRWFVQREYFLIMGKFQNEYDTHSEIKYKYKLFKRGIDYDLIY